MKRATILGILVGLLVLGASLNTFTTLGNGQDGEEDLVKFKVEYNKVISIGDSDTWNFIVHNINCTADSNGTILFFFKIYLDNSLLWDEYDNTTYQTWELSVGSTTTRNYTFPVWSDPVAKHKIRIELYWYKDGTPILMVKHTKVVHPSTPNFIIGWLSSKKTVSRGTGSPSNLSISFTNGGNDDMYNVSISVIDADELEITPQSQDLGNIEMGENKTVIFSVMAPATKEPARTHNPKFQITYNDFMNVTHSEEYVAVVKATAVPIIYHLLNILGGIAIAVAAGGAIAFVALVKRSKKRMNVSTQKLNY
ncbi:MAG: hypothetical protein ACE5I5_20120 [Candidatus Heimdallarchaeota archaeon]